MKNIVYKDKILTDRERKNLAILETIRKEGPITKTEISKNVGLNIVTITNYVNHYIEKKMVFEKGYDVSEGGRRPMLIELNPNSGYIIGLGLNMEDIVGVMTNLSVEIIKEVRRDKPSLENSEECLYVMMDIIDELIKDTDVSRDKILGIGIGLPGIIDERERTIRWPGKLGTEDIMVTVSVEDMFRKKFDIPTTVENDATSAVFGEKWLGFQSDVKNMLYMFSGVGCGIIINGQIFHGSSGCAGELGIANLSEESMDELQEEAYGLGRWNMDIGILDQAKRVAKDNVSWSLSEKAKKDINSLTLNDIFQSAKNGDELSQSLVENGGINLGRKIAFLANLLNPEIVVIGGGLEAAGSLLMDAIKTTVKKWTIDEVNRVLRIVPAQFAEKAVALGVSCVVSQNIFMKS